MKKIKSTCKPVFSVAWIPKKDMDKPLNEEEVIARGGRIIDTNFSKLAVDEFVQCLNKGTKGLEGEYIEFGC